MKLAERRWKGIRRVVMDEKLDVATALLLPCSRLSSFPSPTTRRTGPTDDINAECPFSSQTSPAPSTSSCWRTPPPSVPTRSTRTRLIRVRRTRPVRVRRTPPNSWWRPSWPSSVGRPPFLTSLCRSRSVSRCVALLALPCNALR